MDYASMAQLVDAIGSNPGFYRFESYQKYFKGRYTVSSSGVDCKSIAFWLGWCNSITAHLS